ncbi:hypothetical protein RAC83_000826 [Xylella fastidiosa]|nr:hypothetical protein [Xylella fastidiosa]
MRLAYIINAVCVSPKCCVAMRSSSNIRLRCINAECEFSGRKCGGFSFYWESQ